MGTIPPLTWTTELNSDKNTLTQVLNSRFKVVTDMKHHVVCVMRDDKVVERIRYEPDQYTYEDQMHFVAGLATHLHLFKDIFNINNQD